MKGLKRLSGNHKRLFFWGFRAWIFGVVEVAGLSGTAQNHHRGDFTGFEIQGAAAIGKAGIPGDIKMAAAMAVDRILFHGAMGQCIPWVHTGRVVKHSGFQPEHKLNACLSDGKNSGAYFP